MHLPEFGMSTAFVIRFIRDEYRKHYSQSELKLENLIIINNKSNELCLKCIYIFWLSDVMNYVLYT